MMRRVQLMMHEEVRGPTATLGIRSSTMAKPATMRINQGRRESTEPLRYTLQKLSQSLLNINYVSTTPQYFHEWN